MNAEGALELIAIDGPAGLALASPSVGWFVEAREQGAILQAGEVAGRLVTLGRARDLIVPPLVRGVVQNAPPKRLREPVDYRRVLYQLAPLSSSTAEVTPTKSAASSNSDALLFRSPTSGRFWLCPSPGEPPFVSVGSVLEPGTALGLLEVMKTFAQIPYRAEHGLPLRAKVVRVLVVDGAEVEEGTAVVQIEPA